ncbi:MAG: hypothetical protein AAF431_12545 [Pseudomonadota bacterium]
MAESAKSTYSFIGIAFGAAALLLALVHFWAGPFSPQPSLEQSVAETAVAIKEATLSALKGEEIPASTRSSDRDLDEIARLATAVMGGLAIILGVLGYAQREPLRVAGGAGLLGGIAIAFQFFAFALGAIIVVILVAAVLSNFDIG